MPLSKIITHLQRPLQKKRKLFLLVLTLLVIIGGLGAAYYFYIQSDEKRIIRYKTQQLDNYFQKFKRKLDNDQLIKNATRDTLSPSSDEIPKEKKDVTPKEEDVECNFIKYFLDSNHSNKNYDQDLSRCLDKFIKNQLAYKKDFSEYVLQVEYKIQKEDDHQKDVIISSSSFDGLRERELINILDQEDLWFTQKKELTINHDPYLALAKRYSYASKTSNPDIELDITITGLNTIKSFDQEVGQLDPALIALLITVLLIMVIGLPFFKLLFISEDERLFSYDVIFAGISTILGAPIIFILLISIHQFFYEYSTKQNELVSMAEEIKNKFEQENRSITDAISAFDYGNYEREVEEKQSNDDERISFIQVHLSKNKAFDTTSLKHFKYVSKLDSDGKAKYHINYISAPPPDKAPRDLSRRNYFKDLKTGRNVWNNKAFSYVMRPVVSIENNSEEAVYAKWTDKEKHSIEIFSTQLKSLHSSNVPIGFHFAVLDENGEVWFHSEPGKSTLENFFDLSKNDKALEAAVKGRIKAKGTFDYHGDDQLFANIPISGTNLSVVSFYDIELIGLQISEVLSLTSISFLILTFFIALTVLVSVFFKNPKWGLYKFNRFPFQFLLPKKNLSKVYMYLTLIFVVLFVVLAFYRVDNNAPSFTFFLGVIVAYWSYLLCFFVLKSPNRASKIDIREGSILLISILLNIIIIVSVEDAIDLLRLIIVELIFIFFISLSKSRWFKRLFCPELYKSYDSDDTDDKNIEYKYSYVNFLAAWLFSSAMLPVFLFYQNANFINKEVWLKANLFEFAEYHQVKDNMLINNILKPIDDTKFDNPEDKNIYKEAYENLIKEHQEKGNYYLDNLQLNDVNDTLQVSKIDSIFEDIIWQLRPVYNERSRKYQHFSQTKAHDDTWISKSLGDTLIFQLRNEQDNMLKHINYIKKEPPKNFANFIFSGRLFFNIIGLLFIFGIFYWLILFYVDRCYAFRFFYLTPSQVDKNKKGVKSYILHLQNLLFSNQSDLGLFITGLPSTGKQTFAEQILEEKSYQTISCSLLSSCTKEDSIVDVIQKICIDKKSDVDVHQTTYFILQNFEHHLLSFEQNHLKVQLISYLLANRKKIIITSEIYPSQVFDVYKDQVGQTGELKADIASDYNGWRDILGGFYQIQLGITKQDKLVDEAIADLNLNDFKANSISLLKAEFGFSKYLPSISPIVLSKCTYTDMRNGVVKQIFDQQRMVQHGMMMAYGYYTDIWNALPRREKYILYDLAKDGFMNIKNSNSLFSLMKKGLIVWHDTPQVFNLSFRNFIIAVGQKDIELSKEKRQEGQQNWGTTKIIILIIIVAIIIFIIIGNPGIVKELETFYGALAGLGALIPIMSSLLGKGGRS